MASADFSLRLTASPFQAQGEISPGKGSWLSPHNRRIYGPASWSRELRSQLPARPCQYRLVSDSCSSARGFVIRFLQRFPRGRRLAVHSGSLRPGSPEDFHLLAHAHAGRTTRRPHSLRERAAQTSASRARPERRARRSGTRRASRMRRRMSPGPPLIEFFRSPNVIEFANAEYRRPPDRGSVTSTAGAGHPGGRSEARPRSRSTDGPPCNERDAAERSRAPTRRRARRCGGSRASGNASRSESQLAARERRAAAMARPGPRGTVAGRRGKPRESDAPPRWPAPAHAARPQQGQQQALAPRPGTPALTVLRRRPQVRAGT